MFAGVLSVLTFANEPAATRCESQNQVRPDRPSASAEGESVSLYAGIEKMNLERVIGNGAGGAHELIQALRRYLPIALSVGIHAVSLARRLAVDGDTEADFIAFRRRAVKAAPKGCYATP